MKTISLSALDSVTGGRSIVAQNVCNRDQYNWMVDHMVPDGVMKPGVQRHVLVRDAHTCGFPQPPAAKR
jgi:hypothetical protein